MGRLKKRKFNDFDEFLDFQEENLFTVQLETLEKLEKYFKKNQQVGLVDVFEVELADLEGIEELYTGTEKLFKMSIFENQWGEALQMALDHFLEIEDYKLAGRVKTLQDKIK